MSPRHGVGHTRATVEQLCAWPAIPMGGTTDPLELTFTDAGVFRGAVRHQNAAIEFERAPKACVVVPLPQHEYDALALATHVAAIQSATDYAATGSTVLSAIDRLAPGLRDGDRFDVPTALRACIVRMGVRCASQSVWRSLLSSPADERARIARELHDKFGQTLTAMRADTTWLLRKCADRADLHDVLPGLAQQCEHLHLDARDLLARLRPHTTQAAAGVPLRQMLEDLLRGWRTCLHDEAHFTMRCAVDATTIPADLALAVYRLTQEALTSAVRHSQASTVEIVLARATDAALNWSVSNAGVGIDSVGDAMPRGRACACRHASRRQGRAGAG